MRSLKDINLLPTSHLHFSIARIKKKLIVKSKIPQLFSL